MKIEKIENDKIKVSLSREDLISYNISGENVKRDPRKLQGFLFDIMQDVQEQTGFNPYNGQVVVEAVEDRDGITLFISKLKNIGDSGYKNPFSKKVKSVKIAKSVHKTRYVFKSFENLCSAFSNTEPENFLRCSLYKYEDSWYLGVPSDNNELNSLMREFCDEVKEHVLSELFLKEHGKLIAKNEKLISMVKGIKSLD